MNPTANVPTTSDPPATMLFGWVWGTLSFVGWAAGLLGVLLLLSSLFMELSLPHGMMLATAAALGTVVGGAGVLMAGRLAFGRLLVASPTACVVLGLGALLAGAVQVALVDWTNARLGYFDPEMIGASGFLFAALSGMTVAAFGALTAPRGARTPPTLAALAGVSLSLLIVVSNAPGLEGGVPPASMPLAVALIVAGGFSLSVGALVARRALAT